MMLIDTKGPEIRTGLLKNGGKPIVLKSGQTLKILTAANFETFEGDESTICVDYRNLNKVVKEGSIIKIDDGLIVTKVVATTDDSVTVTVLNTSDMGQRKGKSKIILINAIHHNNSFVLSFLFCLY